MELGSIYVGLLRYQIYSKYLLEMLDYDKQLVIHREWSIGRYAMLRKSSFRIVYEFSHGHAYAMLIYVSNYPSVACLR